MTSSSAERTAAAGAADVDDRRLSTARMRRHSSHFFPFATRIGPRRAPAGFVKQTAYPVLNARCAHWSTSTGPSRRLFMSALASLKKYWYWAGLVLLERADRVRSPLSRRARSAGSSSSARRSLAADRLQGADAERAGRAVRCAHAVPPLTPQLRRYPREVRLRSPRAPLRALRSQRPTGFHQRPVRARRSSDDLATLLDQPRQEAAKVTLYAAFGRISAHPILPCSRSRSR